MNPIREKVETALSIVEQLYAIEENNIKVKRENISRINLDSLTELIAKELNHDREIKEKDIVAYIEKIIQD